MSTLRERLRRTYRKMARIDVCLYCGREVPEDGIHAGVGGSWCSQEHYDLDQSTQF